MFGETRVFAATMFCRNSTISILASWVDNSPVCVLRCIYKRMQDIVSAIVPSFHRHLGAWICCNWYSSANHARAEMDSGSVSSSSQYMPAVHISWSSIFARIVKGAINPIGSKRVAIFFNNILFVYVVSSSGTFSLNVNTSVSAHHTPRVFGHGS